MSTHSEAIAVTPGIVDFWDFSEPETACSWSSKAGQKTKTLRVAAGNPRTTTGGPLSGRSLILDGRQDYLVLPHQELGELNIFGKDAEVTVIAWIWKESPGNGFIGGIWQEHDGDPKRQYGLFVNLPLYGGKDQVCGHVSFSGGPSPGLPYSRDHSANITPVPFCQWACVAFTYDGREARSYLNGVFEPRPTYTEPGPPYGAGLTYSKNPYRFAEGLGNNGGDFTVGAVLLTKGMGNHFGGRLGGLAVFNRALTESEMKCICTE